jgi:hypothetical protein
MWKKKDKREATFNPSLMRLKEIFMRVFPGKQDISISS